MCLQETTRADGAWGPRVERFEAKHAAEKELSAAEAEVAKQKGRKGGPSKSALARLEAAETRMEEIMQEGLETFAEE